MGIGELIALLGVAGAAAGAALVHYVSGRSSTRRWLKRMPRYRIDDFPENAQGVVEGTVHALPGKPLLEAPFSKQPCVSYQLLIETNVDWLADGWLLVHSEAECATFEVREGDASARVDASKDVEVLSEQHIWNANEGSDVLIRRILRDRDLLADRPLTQPLRMIEELVTAGDSVAVAGRGQREPDPRSNQEKLYRDPPTRLVMRAQDSARPLLIASPPSRSTEVRERSKRVR